MSERRFLKSSSSFCSSKDMGTYRVAFLGAAGVGKSSIIRQFVYEQFDVKYTKTVEELHRAEFTVDGVKITFDILDTAGAYDFPAMRNLAIARSDAFVLVYSVDSEQSFQDVSKLQQLILAGRGPDDVPIVVVGNKSDVICKQSRAISKATADGIACVDWNNAYVEVSAKHNENIVTIFQEMLRLAKIQFNLRPAIEKRRQSLPAMNKKISNNSNNKTETNKSVKAKGKKTFLKSLFSLPRSKSI